MKNCIRVINENFNAMGRRFVKRDVVIMLNGNMFHIYPETDGLDNLKDELSDVSKENIEKILDNSIDM